MIDRETVEYLFDRGKQAASDGARIDDLLKQLAAPAPEPSLNVDDPQSVVALLDEGVREEFTQRVIYDQEMLWLEWRGSDGKLTYHTFDMDRSTVFNQLSRPSTLKSAHELYAALRGDLRPYVDSKVVALVKSISETKRTVTDRGETGMKREYANELIVGGGALPSSITFTDVPVFDPNYIDNEDAAIVTLELTLAVNDDLSIRLAPNQVDITKKCRAAQKWLLAPIVTACESLSIPMYKGRIDS